MPITLGPYFVEDDFHRNAAIIHTMAEKYLGVEIETVVFDKTSAPLGEGENSLTVKLDPVVRTEEVTGEAVSALEKEFRQRWGYLTVQVESTCPLCRENSFQHYGYVPADEFGPAEGCMACLSKERKRAEQTADCQCYTCDKVFTVDSQPASYSWYLDCGVTNHKSGSRQSFHAGRRPDTEHGLAHFCSKACAQAKFAEALENLHVIFDED